MKRIFLALTALLGTAEVAPAQNTVVYRHGTGGNPKVEVRGFVNPSVPRVPRSGGPAPTSRSPASASTSRAPAQPQPTSLQERFPTIVAPLRASMSLARSLRPHEVAFRIPGRATQHWEVEATSFDLDKKLTNVMEANELFHAIKEKTDRLTIPLEQAANRLEDAIKGDTFRSDNDLINRIHDLVREWNNKHGDTARRDVNAWIKAATIDGNGFDAAIKQLEAERDKFRRFATACATQSSVVWCLNIADHMDVKDFGQWLVSTKGLDIEARKETLAEIKRCVTHTEHAVQQLDRVIGELRQTRDVRDAIFREAPEFFRTSKDYH